MNVRMSLIHKTWQYRIFSLITAAVLVFSLGAFTSQGVIASPSTAYMIVDTFADEYTNNSTCSLREAITAINAGGDFYGCELGTYIPLTIWLDGIRVSGKQD